MRGGPLQLCLFHLKQKPVFLFGLVVLNVITLTHLILKNFLIGFFTNYLSFTSVHYKITFVRMPFIMLLLFFLSGKVTYIFTQIIPKLENIEKQM